MLGPVRSLRIVLVLAAALAPATGSAQADAGVQQRGFCWEGHPAERCRAFLVMEGSAHAVIAGSTYSRQGFRGETTRSRHLAPHVALDVGVMRNVSSRDAAGAVLQLGGDANGIRLGLKGRYRRWTSPRTAVDVSGGMLVARRAEPYAPGERRGNYHLPVTGVTADLSLGLTQWAGVSVRGDLLFDEDGERSSGLYGGIKLGTRPTLAGLALPILGSALIFLVAGGGGS